MCTVLTFNSGSSSLKVGLYDVQPTTLTALYEAGTSDLGRRFAPDAPTPESLEEAMARLLKDIPLRPGTIPDAIGHRIVHGGPDLHLPVRIDGTVMQQLIEAARFDPLHAPAALAGIHWAQAHWPDVPQIACFDTAFHADLPPAARYLPIGNLGAYAGLRRFGFHGLSCESILRALGEHLPHRLVIAHLGSGASVTAVLGGRSIDTSMGLTPTGGVLMSTRSGDLDPGVLIWLMREQHLNAEQLEDLVERHSGLLGVSGLAGDLRQLRAAADSVPRARLAIALFCRAVSKQIAGMVSVLGGLDALVFTGGIGEHDADTRAEVCRQLSCFDLYVDDEHNRTGQDPIHAAHSKCEVRVLPARENEEIARHCAALLAVRAD